mmetsp:Transcript_45560/g.142692  ORF Transcript_45560/g.142692 Transcript_45560/m.142692 type:complete len:327 (-) Transcript_45560:302-1282(-)
MGWAFRERPPSQGEGNDHFRAKRFPEAIAAYSEAINLSPDDHTFYSNRSAAYAAIGEWENAAADGQNCITKNREWIKGYFRLATAQQNMGQYQDAIDTLTRGKALADLPKQTRDELATKVAECRAAMVRDRTAACIESANKLLANDDIKGALQMAEAGLRQDPESAELKSLKARVEPMFQRQEKQRVAGLSRTELLKEEGDKLFKAAQFENAIEKYSKCLDAEGSMTTPLAVKCLLNRSACYKQLSNFSGVIDDTSYVLEEHPENVKALIRRAQAFEACERYRLALQDVRTAIGLGISVIGNANFTLCTSMQGRLDRAIRIDRAQS